MEPPLHEARPLARPQSRSGLRDVQSPKQKSSPTSTTTTFLGPSPISKTTSRAAPARPSMEASSEELGTRPFMGQLSATQTMVVTTTTTTTTNFPPLLLNPPRHLHDMDPKQYPLATAPTPASVKKISFGVGGSRTTFEEAESPCMKTDQEQRSYSEHSWPGRSPPDEMSPPLGPPTSHVTRLAIQNPQHSLQTPRTAPESTRKRPTSPISISEAAHRAQERSTRRKRILPSPSLRKSSTSTRQASLSRLRATQTSTPLTPDVGASYPAGDLEEAEKGHRNDHSHTGATKSSPSSVDSDDEGCQIMSPQSEMARSLSFQEEIASQVPPPEQVQPGWEMLESGFAITPNPEEDSSALNPMLQTASIQRPPRPSSLNTAASHDASLPSPSLSPVTAAANLQNRRSYFGQIGSSRSRTMRSNAQTASEQRRDTSPVQLSLDLKADDSSALAPISQEEVDEEGDVGHENANNALMKLPTMIDTFEAMPEEMKSYIMYQMLRRCSKPVLHFVAEVVNPALKCDYLRNLPVELCLNIIGYLDVKSLCAAAQVSKRWRRLIDSAEKVWKRLFDISGFQLQEGELARAIREGWGWQFASGVADFEQDLSPSGVLAAELKSSPSNAVVIQSRKASSQQPLLEASESSMQLRRSKRKAKSKTKTTSRKQLKSSHMYSNAALDMDDEAFLDMASATEGPYAAATAAAAAVPYPGIGLPSLENLHLFKSIYMRHHVIKNTWMDEEVTPRHIAFRAHQRHVVTCLQFDADKILTGSDDSNINVYDTQTGALRATLEGHDGGVWALQYEGNMLVSGSTDRSVRVWDIERGVCTQTFQGHTSTVRCLQILMPTQIGKTADGKPIIMPKEPLIITGSRDSHLRVWKLPKKTDPAFHQAGPAPDESYECPYFVRALLGHHHSVRAIAAHGDTLVSGSYDCTVRVWKISTGETVHRLQGHTQKVYSVVLDHKRNRCISGSMDNVVKVWSLETGASLFNLEGHSSLVGLLDLQQDRLVSAAADSTLRIWDPENGQCKSTLTAHTGAITCFQHDEQKVISGSDRTLKMWDVTTGEFVKDLLTDLSGVWQVKFNERRCVAAVQRKNLTYIEVLDFGALRDGVPESKRGRRIVVNERGRETYDFSEGSHEQAEQEL